MKFTRKEYIITTIFDKELTKEEDIQTVFDNLHDHRIEFSMTISKVTPSQDDCFRITYEKVRILKIYDDATCDLLAFKNGANLSMKKVAFSDVVEIHAITKKYKILDIDSDITRFDLLDL